MNETILKLASAQARGLAIDAVHACSSGHLGLPLGCAEIGAVLFGESLQINPKAPKWLNRDRFILSAGHGSMFLYTWLHLSGYELSLQEVKNFRQLHSKTPGHPEFNETPGVEATTGPLGQGIGNAVGYALSGKRSAAKYNTDEHTIFDNHVIVLAGDGCIQEGVAKEAIEFAGHNKLDNLVLIYDSNDVTLDAMADVTQSTQAEGYFSSQGWDVVTIDGHSFKEINKAIRDAKAATNGKPTVIVAKTVIGQGIPEVAGTQKAHGESGANFVESARKNLGLPEESFYVSQEVRSYFETKEEERVTLFHSWQQTFEDWSCANPELAEELNSGVAQLVPTNLLDSIPKVEANYKAATRATGGEVINQIAQKIPQLLTGSADLYGSTKNYLKGQGDFSATDATGRNIWFGIREHAMGAICNGVAYDGIFRISGATFLVFADYLRPSIRLAALANLPVTYIFTHDSVGVGEDGPTHQPVETVSGLRVIPGLDVIRPGDPEEVAAAYVVAMSKTESPTALILTRQGVPNYSSVPAENRREGTLKGAYILKKEEGELRAIVMASGSEVQHAVAAAEEIGEGIRVVSVPCFEFFKRQTDAYRESVLPKSCVTRVAIEAGVSDLWYQFVGLEGKVLGIDQFGMSAPGNTVMKELGMTSQHVVAAVKELLG